MASPRDMPTGPQGHVLMLAAGDRPEEAVRQGGIPTLRACHRRGWLDDDMRLTVAGRGALIRFMEVD